MMSSFHSVELARLRSYALFLIQPLIIIIIHPSYRCIIPHMAGNFKGARRPSEFTVMVLNFVMV